MQLNIPSTGHHTSRVSQGAKATIMPKFLIFILFASTVGRSLAAPQASSDAHLSKARLLYSCFSFTRAMSQSTADVTQQDKLRNLSNNFLIIATSEVVAADEDHNPLHNDLALQYGKLGESDFKALLDKVIALPTEQESNAKLGEFAHLCSTAVEANR